MGYEEIKGFFGFSKIYNEMIDKFDNAIFVEIGCFFGRSSVYLAEKIKKSNKNIKLYCIDSWKNDSIELQEEYRKNGNIYERFMNNVQKYKVDDIIITIKDKSENAVKKFKDKSIDFVFLDASHQYPEIKKDIMLWTPKIRNGGILGGDDYDWEGVTQAVSESILSKNLHIEPRNGNKDCAFDIDAGNYWWTII